MPMGKAWLGLISGCDPDPDPGSNRTSDPMKDFFMSWRRLETFTRSLSVYFHLPGAAVLLLASAAQGGEPDAGPAPPAHLPRFIWECEAATGASSNTCSVWVWHGSSYSATWSIGAMGQLTVASGGGNAAELRVRRVDTAGTLAGLDATYTGKWNGTQFTDGKMTFTFKGASNTGIWTGVPELTPVVHTDFGKVETVQQRERDYWGKTSPYYNWYAADLTGFAIYTKGIAGSQAATAIEDYRVRGESPMKPGERRTISVRAHLLPLNYEKGAVYHPGTAVAAIYSDGTTFGDRNVLSAMIDFRRSMLGALTNIGATLCKLGGQQSIRDIQIALDKQQAAEDTRLPADKGARGAAYSWVGKAMIARGNGRMTPSQVVKNTLDRLNQLRVGLADPVKNGSGQPAIASVSAPACSLR